MTDTPIGTGSRMRTVDRFMVEAMSEIAVLDPPHKYASEVVAGYFPSEITLDFESKEHGPRVTSHGEIEFKGVFKLFESLFSKQIEKQKKGDFDRLKLLLERG
jgi:hypothetical protein